MTTQEIGSRLVALFREGKFEEIYTELYSPEIASIEAVPGDDQVAKGFEAINAKNEWWFSTFEPVKMEVEGPWPHGDQFILTFDIETINRETKERNAMKEAALYTVKDGKVVEERFFYDF